MTTTIRNLLKIALLGCAVVLSILPAYAGRICTNDIDDECVKYLPGYKALQQCSAANGMSDRLRCRQNLPVNETRGP